ncbi:hypothetical protein BsWGS_08597 [Bradybaena similaris]
MNVSRFVSLISKPGLQPVLGALSRTISTGRDQVRFGNVSGKTKVPKHRELDVLLGRWVHDPNSPYGDQTQSTVSIERRGYINFARNNGTWIYEQGITGGGRLVTYRFSLNAIFIPPSLDGTVLRARVEQMSHNGLRFNFCTLLDDAIIFSFSTQAIEDKLFLRTRNDDGTYVTKVYLRQ